MIRRFSLSALSAALLVATACSGISEPLPVPEPVEAPVGVTGSDGPQLVTEQYKRRQLDLHVIQSIDEPVAQALLDEHAVVLRSGLLDTWDKSPLGFVDYRPRGYTGPAFRAHVLFGSPGYAPDGGHITTSDCRELPGAGVQTTGEFTSVDNETDSPIEHKISKSVTESSSTTNTMTESVEYGSGESVEAGTSFPGGEAKATLSFDQHFGFGTESVASTSSETNVTVEDIIEVDGGLEYDVSFTTDNSRTSCLLDISAEGDYGDLRILPPTGRPYSWSTWCGDGGRDDPNNLAPAFRGRGSNGAILLHSDAVDRSDCSIRLDEADALIRLLTGFDVRCPHCGDISLDKIGSRGLDWFGKAQSRHVSFTGRQLSAAHADASYKALDVTGYDRDCVRDILDDAGTPITDDLLAPCAPDTTANGATAVTREAWAVAFIDALGHAATAAAVDCVVAWADGEGSGAWFNPLDTERRTDNSTDYNTAGVQSYPTLDAGVAATVDTLREPGAAGYGYPAIDAALAGGYSLPDCSAAIISSAWGTTSLPHTVTDAMHDVLVGAPA